MHEFCFAGSTIQITFKNPHYCFLYYIAKFSMALEIMCRHTFKMQSKESKVLGVSITGFFSALQLSA